MIGAIMVYGLALGVLLAGAAWSLERGLRSSRLPFRWVWLVGLLAVALIPLGARAPSPPPLGEDPATFSPSEGVMARPDLIPGGQRRFQKLPSVPPALDRHLAILWVLSSGLVLLALAWTWGRLHRSATDWKRETLRGREVLLSRGLGPAVLGALRPMIVLPSWALDLEAEGLDMVLTHEEEHRNARDPALLLLGLLAVAAAPWNPLMWWMLPRLRLAVEADCDRRVLARGVPPRAYGALLLEIASGSRGLSMFSPALVEGGPSFLERRLLMIHSKVGRHGIASAALAVSVSAVLVALACETPTPPASEEVSDAEVEGLPVPTEIAQQSDGYYLVRKTGEEVEYVRSVPAGELEAMKESGDESPAFVVGEVTRDRSEDPRPQPLVIVDGVITDYGLADIQSVDVESIEIVKGDVAKTMYGARAANGVVIVTTKEGGGIPRP